MVASVVFLSVLASSACGWNQDLDNHLKPVATVEMRASIGEMALSPDGSWVYLLNLSDGKLQRLDTAKRALDAVTVELPEFARALAVPPNGKTLYVAAAAGSPNDGMSVPPGAPPGKIQLIDAATFKLRKSNSVEFWPFSIAVTDSGTLFASGKPRLGPPEMVVLDGAKVSRKIDGWRLDSGLLRLSPDQKWVYVAVGAFNRFSVSTGKGELPPNVVPAMVPLEVAGGPYILSADGAYQVGGYGAVLKLLKARKEDTNVVAQIAPHLAAAFDADVPKLLLVTTPDAFLKIYSFPDLKVARSFKLDAPLYRAVLDRKTRILYGCAHDAAASQPSVGINGLGSLHVYDLSKPLEEALK